MDIGFPFGFKKKATEKGTIRYYRPKRPRFPGESPASLFGSRCTSIRSLGTSASDTQTHSTQIQYHLKENNRTFFFWEIKGTFSGFSWEAPAMRDRLWDFPPGSPRGKPRHPPGARTPGLPPSMRR